MPWESIQRLKLCKSVPSHHVTNVIFGPISRRTKACSWLSSCFGPLLFPCLYSVLSGPMSQAWLGISIRGGPRGRWSIKCESFSQKFPTSTHSPLNNMTTITDADIDPQLLAPDNDPSMQFFARPHPRSSSPYNDATSEPGGEHNELQGHTSSFNDFENDKDNHTTKACNLRAFSQMITRSKKLSARGTSDFSIYCEASTYSLCEFTLAYSFFCTSDRACGGAFSSPLCPCFGEPGSAEGINEAWTMGYYWRTQGKYLVCHSESSNKIIISEKHLGLYEGIFTFTNSERIQRKCSRTCLGTNTIFHLIWLCWFCSRKRCMLSMSVAFQRRMRLYRSRSYCRLSEAHSQLSETPWRQK